MKRLLLLLSLFVSLGQVWAAPQTIKGKVLSADGEPIIGAAVSVVGTSQGTITDYDGSFTLSVEPDAKLRISFVGMKTVEVAAKDGMVVELAEDNELLDEVMVIGYGTTTRAQFVGSAKEIEGEDFTKQATSNVTNAMQGKMAGVQVVNNSGQPGTGASIRIRGIGSINGGTTPLYIVDGAPYEAGNINLISSYDIASVTVLKDAAATAIYGARGANGVVLITTKNGNNDSKFTVNIDAKWGNSQRAVPNYNVMTDPAMYMEYAYRALFNSQYYNGSTAADAYRYADKTIYTQTGVGYQIYTVPDGEKVIGTNFKLNPHATLGYNDGKYFYTPDNWEKNSLNTGNLRHEYNVNIQGGNKDTQYFISAGYLSDPGIISGSSFERFTIRSRVDSQVKKWLKVGAQANYAHGTIENPGYQTDWGSSGNIFYTMNNMAPIYPFFVRDAEGNIKVDANGYTVFDTGTNTNQTRSGSAPKGNNAINLNIDDNKSVSDYFSGSIYATITPVEGLNITARVSPEVVNTRSHWLSNPFYGSTSQGGVVEVESTRLFALNQQYLASYKKEFADIHRLEVLAGWEMYNYKEQDLDAWNDHMYNPFIPELSNTYGAQPISQQASSYTMTFSTAGLMARVQYDLMDRYFVNATYRYEGSSRFSKAHRWGHFGSVGAAWLINRESFLSGVSNIDELKLKASWGTQGNDQIGSGIGAYYAYQDLYTISYNSETGEFSKVLSLKGNEELTWEKQMLSNVGLEFGFFKNRLNGSIEYFNRTNSGMLFSVTMPPSAGFASLRQNVGTVVNNGLEVELEGVLLNMRNVKWSINANATYIKSLIKELPDIYKEGGLKSSSYIMREGGSLVEGFLPVYAGVDAETGRALYYADPDNGDMTTTTDYSAAQHSDIGDLAVKVYGGFGTTLEAYGVDLSIQCAYQLGGKQYDGGYQELMHSGAEVGRNWHMDILNAWTPENPNTDVPRICSSDDWDQDVSTRWLVSSNYLSLNNITLGYTLPAKYTKKAKMEKVRFFFQGDNLGLLSARKGFDPRQGQNSQATGLGISTNSGNYVYSLLRTLSGGVSITF
ncbi:MAG: TonB-dependent receptor [Paludibacteraceae bacterium]|nr:TonB-dependent receptor [Paludibacteraceae bacterium]